MPSEDLAASAGPLASVTGPVAPTAAAAGSHQSLARVRLTAGLLHQWQQRNLTASLPLALRQLEDAGNLDNVRLAIQAARAAQPKPGYPILHRSWRPDDLVALHLDVTPRWTYPDRRVDAVRGCVAIERGPLVYCFEQAPIPPRG